ncbi:MAG: lysozyme inhibitor LprI family protein [Hyphomicrobium sp.]
MPFRTLPAIFSALIFTSVATRAEDEPKIDCGAALSTFEMNACAEKDFAAADAALNDIYKIALAAVPEMAGDAPYDAKSWEAALRASQRAWVAFRDAECHGHVPMFWTGGTGATADILGCQTSMTNERIKALKERYADR